MGFAVAKPWGDSDRYDLVVDVDGRLLKVQVKSAHCVSASPGGGYNLRCCGHRRKSYTAAEIDVLVGYIATENIWYIFPPRALKKMKSLRLFPHHKHRISKFGFLARGGLRKQNLNRQQTRPDYDGAVSHIKRRPLIGSDVKEQKIHDSPAEQAIPQIAERAA
jgi:PD-(D/E)XK endonuclease